jgi:RNA polymerase sigma factor (sigma-70 family)
MGAISATRGLTEEELREAQRGFTLMLRRKRFSPRWIEEHTADLLGQASNEYAEKLAKGEPVHNPIGWLIVCAWRRAQNLLDSQSRKPRLSSLDSAFHLADDSTPTPEQRALDDDRHERLRTALSHLPEKERKMLALVYFEEHSIREAGRKVGWQKSAADRHHDAALEKMRALLGADRSLLSPASLGLGSWVIAWGEGHRPLNAALDTALTPGREALAAGAELLSASLHRGSGLLQRLSPFADPSGAAVAGGGGRALGACGAAVAAVVCGIATSGVAPWVDGGIAARSQPPSKPTVAQPTRDSLAPTPTPGARASEMVRSRRTQSAATNSTPSLQGKPGPAEFPTRQKATTRETINEFGVEAGAAPEASSAAAPESTASPVPSAASRPGSGPSASSSPDSSAGPEFGL